MDCLDSLNEAVRSAYGKGQVPGGGMIFPGYYTSPGAAFFGPLVTTAVVTAVTGVIVVAVDDDDDENRAASP